MYLVPEATCLMKLICIIISQYKFYSDTGQGSKHSVHMCTTKYSICVHNKVYVCTYIAHIQYYTHVQYTSCCSVTTVLSVTYLTEVEEVARGWTLKTSNPTHVFISSKMFLKVLDKQTIIEKYIILYHIMYMYMYKTCHTLNRCLQEK